MSLRFLHFDRMLLRFTEKKERSGKYGLSSNEAQAHEGWFGRSDGISAILARSEKATQMHHKTVSLWRYLDKSFPFLRS